VPLSSLVFNSAIAEAASRLVAKQAQEAEAAAEAWRTEGHVFTMEDGRALDPAYVTRLFQTLRKGSGSHCRRSVSTA
jgi:hypothetical protein